MKYAVTCMIAAACLWHLMRNSYGYDGGTMVRVAFYLKAAMLAAFYWAIIFKIRKSWA